MPPFKRSLPKPRVVKKRLADGSIKVYRYEKRKPVSRHAEDSIGALTIAYRLSPEWLGLAESTRSTYSVYLKDVERLQGMPVKAITRRQIIELRNTIAARRGNGASTGFLRSASALFTWAIDNDWIEHSPANRVKPIPGGHLPSWTWEQAQHAMTHLPEPYRRAVVLAVYIGQRRGDLAALQWSDIAGNQIRLTQQKTKTKLVIPVHPALGAELAAWRKDAPSPFILTSDRGKPWSGQNLSHMLPQALEKIGLPPLGIHGCRKLAAARLAEAGASMHEIAAVTGHKSLSMIQLYTASADQERMASAAVARLPGQTADKPATALKTRR
jgi:integrase